MFLRFAVHVLCVVNLALISAAEDTCVFRHAGISGGAQTSKGPSDQEFLTSTSTPPSENTTICPPGAVDFAIPVETHDDIVISWTEAPCQVSGYLIDLSEDDGFSANLTSGLCTGTKISLKRDMARFFSKYTVSVYSAIVMDDGSILKSAPSNNGFTLCPNRKPESPVDVKVEVDGSGSDSTIKFSWRSTETLWQIQFFLLHYCEEKGGCKARSRTLSSDMSLQLSNLNNNIYSIELYSVSNTRECGEAQGRPYRSVLYGRNIISDFDVNCTRDPRKFHVNLSWNIDPERFALLRPTFTFNYRYRVSGTDIMKNSTDRYDLPKVCNAVSGECSLRLEKILRVDSFFEFGISARSPDSVIYYSEMSSKEKCILKTKALTATGVEIIDRTQNFSSMIDSMETQRVIVIDQNIFSRTDGSVISSMVVIGDPAKMRLPLGRRIPFKRSLDASGKLLPTRITPTDWNVFSIWNTGQTHIVDPIMHCAWMWGSPSDYVVCAIGVQRCIPSSEKSCNGPLTTNKAYGLKIRGCTTAGCADTDMFHFELGNAVPGPDTPETFDDTLAFDVLLALIGCIIVGGLIVVIITVLLLRWSEMREMHHEQRFQLIDFGDGVGGFDSSVDSRDTLRSGSENTNKIIL